MSDPKQHPKDYAIAREICVQLRNGNRKALEPVVERYQKIFLLFLRKRLTGTAGQGIDDLLNNFWIELMNGNAICRFEGSTSLKSFLLCILNHRVKDEWRRMGRHKLRFISLIGGDNDRRSEEELLSAAAADPGAFSPSFHTGAASGKGAVNIVEPTVSKSGEDRMLGRERRRIMHETLLELAELNAVDAALIKMHLEGATYRQMAERELSGTDPDEQTLKRRTDAIKKRFTRQPKGAMAKYKIILERKMEKMGYEAKDMLE